MKDFKKYLNLISPIKENTWLIIREHFRETTLEKGQYFINEGQTAKEFAFLQEGVVRAFYRTNEGTEYNKSFFVFPSILGSYSSLITATPSLFTQQALTNCKLLTADYKTFVQLYDVYPDMERLARRFAENYFVANERKEVEIVLLDANERYLNFRKEYPGLEQLIPQYHIASYLGITPTQLSRIRRKFTQN